MIARTWCCRVPLEHADDAHHHLLRTGVADYRRQLGCVDVQLWRRDQDGWAHFLLLSTWESMTAIRAYAGADPESAVRYLGDDAIALVADDTVTHYRVVSLESRSASAAETSSPLDDDVHRSRPVDPVERLSQEGGNGRAATDA